MVFVAFRQKVFTVHVLFLIEKDSIGSLDVIPPVIAASRAIVGQVGAFFALEILGRAFVLRSDDAVKFLEAKIPFHIGVGNNQTFSSTPGFFSGATDHIRWVDNEESSVMENAASQPVDWKGIRDEMESIRSNIGDLMDRLGEYGVERVSDQDREELAKLQVFLGEAHHSILAATS